MKRIGEMIKRLYRKFVLCTILRNRKLQNKSTFLCYIDYKKAFDSVERHLLLFKLSQAGITGNMYSEISSLYSNPRSRVILNEYETEYFDCPVGVKQGDCLSPTLFAIFINDLATELKNSNIGVILEDNMLCFMQTILFCLQKLRKICSFYSSLLKVGAKNGG